MPVGSKDKELGKWSPNWEGPFKVHQVLPGNAYWLANLQGETHKRFIDECLKHSCHTRVRSTFLVRFYI